MELDLKQIQDLEKYYKINMINKISGLRSPFLVCTQNKAGLANLAIFNSVHHIGSNPPLLGMIFRPLSIERHTYNNIKEIGVYSLNLVHNQMIKEAHQASGKYGIDKSEFDFVNLEKDYFTATNIPLVKESKVQLAMSFVEEHEIKSNGTIHMIGQIERLVIADDMVDATGSILHDKLGSTVVSGLDSYYNVELNDRLQRIKI